MYKCSVPSIIRVFYIKRDNSKADDFIELQA